MLVKLDGSYAEGVFKLSQNNNRAEHHDFRMDSIYDVMDQIKKMNEEEEKGMTYNRGILDENARLAGIASLVNINSESRTADLEVWITEHKREKSFYAAAIDKIMKCAFADLLLDEVFISIPREDQFAVHTIGTLAYAKYEADRQKAGIPESPAADRIAGTFMVVVSREIFLKHSLSSEDCC